MHSVVRWFRTPLPLKFWLFAGLATPFVLAGVLEVARGVQVEFGDAPPPLSHGFKLGVGIVICFAIGGVFVWRAVRAYSRRS